MWKRYLLFILLFSGISVIAKSQNLDVAATISKDSIVVGDQIAYELIVPAECLDSVLFPEYLDDTLTDKISVLKKDKPTFNAEKKLARRTYYLSAYQDGDWEIPEQIVLVNANSDSTLR